MCPAGDTKEDFLMKEFYLKKSPPLLLRKMEEFAFNTTGNEDSDICKKKLLYKAEVIFKISTHTMIVIENSRRLSFFDKLSGFGKISKYSLLVFIVKHLFFLLNFYIV